MALNPTPATVLDEWLNAIDASPLLPEKRPMIIARLTLCVLSLAVFALIAWAAVTKVKEVVSCYGTVVPSGHVQVIQHLEGGIVREILIKEGDVVIPGDVLLRLDPSAAASDLNQLKQERLSIAMQIERDTALVEGRQPDFAQIEGSNPAMIDTQRQAYISAVTANAEDANIIAAQIAQREEAVKALQIKAAALAQGMKIGEEGLSIKQQLYDKGYYSKLHLLEKKQEVTAARGDYSGTLQEVTRTRSEIGEYRSRLDSLQASMRDRARQELAKLQNDLQKNAEAMAKFSDRVGRLEVRAPMHGIVKGLEVTTIGGIITPGQKLMEIVPLDGALDIEAHIRPSEVGHLRPGMPVRIKIHAFDYTRYGTVDGRLDSVSASTFVDEHNQTYFRGVVTLEHPYVGIRPGDNPIVPGMTSDAEIITGQRTLLAYLLKPIEQASDTAFTEK